MAKLYTIYVENAKTRKGGYVSDDTNINKAIVKVMHADNLHGYNHYHILSFFSKPDANRLVKRIKDMMQTTNKSMQTVKFSVELHEFSNAEMEQKINHNKSKKNNGEF